MFCKNIRTYMLKWWLLVQFRSVAIYTTIFLLGFGIYIFGVGYFAADNSSFEKILIEAIAWTQNTTIIAGIFLVLLGSIMYKSSMVEPLRNGSTRREAQVGYEICSVLYFVVYIILYLVVAIVNSLVANKEQYLTHIVDILMIYLLFQGMLKFLYAIYVGKTGNNKVTWLIFNGLFINGMCVFIGIYMIFMFNTATIFSDCIWMYPVFYIIGIMLWIMSVYILKNKRDTIALSDLEGQYLKGGL
ncbi:MAG: hypothetical protein IJC76_05595 [Lachnospiraceae bacterium]|nr:hypothetical protein [Lachnospiraceae bacterium]